jgi:serine/threonine-protein kinase
MDMSESTAHHRPAIDITSDYNPAPIENDNARGRIRLDLISAAGKGQTAEDLRVLLCKRLRFLALLLTGALAFTLPLVAINAATDVWSYITVMVFVFGAVLAGVLWVRQSLSLNQLRAIELALFGAMYAQWSTAHAFLYPSYVISQPPNWFGFIFGYAVSLPWVFLIVFYGILIPNTGTRCAAVVGVMAVTPLAISMLTGIAERATIGYSQANFYLVVGACMAGATAIAVYGSHRIEVLRTEVVAARRLGQYQLGEKLGVGGMGEVYLAEHLLLRRPCAIKLIRPDRCGQPAALDRFEREVRATAMLTHPNTVQVYDYGRAQDGTFYYAMEYLPGMNLEQLMARHGPLPPERAIHFLRQICGALSEAHANGLIHRDIKPSNVIACRRGGLDDVAKLLDFGLVRNTEFGADVGHQTREGAVEGTPAYMSPEQAEGKTNLDFRSDIYSVGALAYHLLTGQPPFVRQTTLQTLIAHVCDPPTPPRQLREEVAADLQAIVLRCMEKDPAQRFFDARSLEKALADCTAGNLWTEKRAADWWHNQISSTGASSPLPDATTLAR